MRIQQYTDEELTLTEKLVNTPVVSLYEKLLAQATRITELEAQLQAAKKDAERYQKLKPMLYGACFEYDEDKILALIFELPKGSKVSANLDATVDALPAITEGKQA